MSAYVIVELEVTDPEQYAAYAKLAEESVARHGAVRHPGGTRRSSRASGRPAW